MFGSEFQGFLHRTRIVGLRPHHPGFNIGAYIITYTILRGPYYNHSIVYPPNPILIVKAPTLGFGVQGLL